MPSAGAPLSRQRRVSLQGDSRKLWLPDLLYPLTNSRKPRVTPQQIKPRIPPHRMRRPVNPKRLLPSNSSERSASPTNAARFGDDEHIAGQLIHTNVAVWRLDVSH